MMQFLLSLRSLRHAFGSWLLVLFLGSLFLMGFPSLAMAQARGAAARQAASAAPRPIPALRWNLPAYAFVEYSRKGGGGMRKGMLSAAAPGFYSYELRKHKELVFTRPALVEVLPMLALSLSGKTPKLGKHIKIRRKVDSCIEAREFEARGSWELIDARNPRRLTQRARIELIGKEAPKRRNHALGRGAVRGFQRRSYLLRGQIEVTRVVDAIAGRVYSFEGHFAATLSRGKGEEETEVELRQLWRFDRIVEADSPEFRKLVNQAIEMGEARLARSRPRSVGYLALVTLTLCKSSTKKSEEPILTLIERLRRSNPQQTYELCVAMQALEAYYAPASEAQDLRSGARSETAKRVLTESDKALMQKWLSRLMKNRSESGGKSYRFHYRGGQSFDNSNTQFAALGFGAAERCGIRIPADAWKGLAKHFVREQLEHERDSIKLRLVSYRNLRSLKEAASKGQKGTRSGAKSVRAQGFNYRKPASTRSRGRGFAPVINPVAYGSMTCAGVTGLTLAQGALAKRHGLAGKLGSQLVEARWRGFAWLYKNYDIRRNPHREGVWYYYYLYSLERTCELSSVARIHDRHWYFDGAMQLLSLQGEGGGWSSAAGDNGGFGRVLVDTCFAILFLKRSVAPVVTR